MPFVSQAQRRKFGELVSQGKMSQAIFDEWNSATGKKKLPDHVKKNKKSQPKKAKFYSDREDMINKMSKGMAKAKSRTGKGKIQQGMAGAL